MATRLTGRHPWLLLSLLLLFAGNSAGAPGDTPEFTYRSNVNEVRLSFSAVDQNNHGVATLQASDFAVVDKDFIVRNFQSFIRADWTKLELAIVLDASESVAPRFRQEIAGILDLVSQTAGVPDENVSLFTFQGLHPALLCAGNCRATNTPAIQLPAARAGGLTPLFDTVVFASDFLWQHGDPHAVKVLILFTDGTDTISRSSLADAIDNALATDVQIYAVDLSSPRSQGGAVLQRLAASTGGRCFPVEDGGSSAMNVILEGFRATYTVSYRLPSHASGFHSVRILPTHNQNLEFRSRSGYYYPARVR